MPVDTILSIDQGTTGSRVFLFDGEGRILGSAYRELTQHFPQPGWVEHDPVQIWDDTIALIGEVLSKTETSATRLAAIGITNQRETLVIWDRRTGRPLSNAIVWQCRRSSGVCDRLRSEGLEPEIRQKTGLVLDAYFTGTKLSWALEHIPGLRSAVARGEAICGTIDSWLIWNLSGGHAHVTDPSNASRTLLYDIRRLDWDEGLLKAMGVLRDMLPTVVPSSGVIAHTAPVGPLPSGVPIAGVAGDQQAALFGQTCFVPGMAKNTYGTGCFLLMATGETPVPSNHGMLTTVAWNLNGRVEYALEGSIFVAGAVIQWLRDGLGIITQAADTEALAQSVADTGGVYLVPAFVGLGAPYWDMYARGTMVGLSRGTTRAHIARAALEAIAYQTRDLLDAMFADLTAAWGEGEERNPPLTRWTDRAVRADGGASRNDFLMQFQADILGVAVERPRVHETTALGAAYLAGLGIGMWGGREELAARWQRDARFDPVLNQGERDRRYADWRRAVERARGWITERGA